MSAVPAATALALALALGRGGPWVPPRRATVPKPVNGVVQGVLRHKGCSSAPADAAVTVIGRDVTARAQPDGRFQLELPAGSYSLVFVGPGLLADQRVDDVTVTAGAARDLGTVEVWPAEPPPGCTPGAVPPPPPGQPVVVAAVPDEPTVDLPGLSVQPAPTPPDAVWVRGGAGNAPGQFGLQGNPARDDEDALGPPSFAVGPLGGLWVLDPVNGRVQRFDPHGRYAGAFPVGGGTEPSFEADLAVADDGHVYLFHQNEVVTLTEYDPTGRVLLSAALPPSFRGVDLLFSGRLRPTFLMLNGQAVKAELAWGGIRAEGPLPGLPVAGLYARADRLDRWRASITLSGADGRVRRSVQLHSHVPIAGVRLVGTSRRGDLVLAVDRSDAGEDGTPRAEVLLLALDAHGRVAGTAHAPPGNRRFEFREFALAPDGTVVQMQSDTSEVRFVRWTLRPPPRDAVAGEGLVQGKVAEGGKPVAGAVVTAEGRGRRTVATGPDGTFELRLPSGMWSVSARRPAFATAPDVQPELRVSVPAGAKVDLGRLGLSRPVPHPAPPPAPPGGRPPVPEGAAERGRAAGGTP